MRRVTREVKLEEIDFLQYPAKSEQERIRHIARRFERSNE